MEVVQVQCGRPRKQTTAQNAAMITRRVHTAAGFSGGRLVGGAEAVASFNPATSIVSCRDATISCRESRDGREDVSKTRSRWFTPESGGLGSGESGRLPRAGPVCASACLPPS